MNVQNLRVKFLLVIFIVVMAILALYPPAKKLKPGIDLAGGHSLLYEIDTTGLEGAQLVNLAQRIITQLRKRVDPNNQRNLVWRPVGNTRIEIQMPAATGESRALRTAKDDVINQLLGPNVSLREIRAALGLPEEQRPEALLALSRGVAARDGLFAELVENYEAYLRIKRGQGDPESDDNEVTAYQKYFQAQQKVLKTNLTRARLIDVLDLGSGPKRDEQLDKIRTTHPTYADQLDGVIEKYDAWSKDRGLLEDPEDLKRLLRGAGVLEFRIMAERQPGNPSRLQARESAYAELVTDYVKQLAERGPRPKPGQHYQWFKMQDHLSYLKATDDDDARARSQTHPTIIEEYAGNFFVLSYTVPDYALLASSQRKWKLESALATRDFNTGRQIVQFRLDPPGGDLFAALTGQNVGRQLGIFLDNECMSSARIMSEIRRSGVIEGDFSQADITYLVNTLEAGSLPARLKEPPLSERSIGSSLGETNRLKGFKAAVAGLICVVVFMLIYYLLCGLVANVALVMNIILVLGAMSVLQATFTLPGIAGLILTVGMAVDANVLILERIREELRRGSSIKMAVKTGYEKAFSTIFDANVTTLITCAILGYAGSEEVKGFAIVLGLGVVFSMFTALFVTRIIFAALIQNGLVKSLPMLRLIGEPKIQWIEMRRVFWPVSIVLVFCGAGLFAYEHRFHASNIYDIEFLGGSAVTIELSEGVVLSDEEVRSRINGAGPEDADPNSSAAGWLRYAAAQTEEVTIRPETQTGVFDLSSAALSAQQLEVVVMAGMADALESLARGGIERIATKKIRIATKPDLKYDSAKVRQGLADSAEYLRAAATKLANAKVVVAWDTIEDRAQAPDTFDINTTETNKELVRQAIIAALGNQLKIQIAVEYVVRTDPIRAPQGYYPIYSEEAILAGLRLESVIGGDTLAGVEGYEGGVAIVFDQLQPPQTEEQLRERLHGARLLPEFEKYNYRPFEIVGLSSLAEDANRPPDEQRLTSFALLVADDNLMYEDAPATWEKELAIPELSQAKEALGSQKTLQRVNQFAPQIAAQMTQRAVMAILLAFVAIVIYIWIRFGNMQFGLAAIVALVHDVTISLGCVAASYYIFAAFGENALLIRDFKIDLPMVAALLTIVGYSLNDTIVVFDRIRENRGKLKDVTQPMINASINQTLSRTVLTSTTTMLAVVVMYTAGGAGIHGFSFAMIIGVVVGTYSSLAIASPLLLHPNLLKWIINLIVAIVLVGFASYMEDRVLQIMAWILAGIFALVVLGNEFRRKGGLRVQLARGPA